MIEKATESKQICCRGVLCLVSRLYRFFFPEQSLLHLHCLTLMFSPLERVCVHMWLASMHVKLNAYSNNSDKLKGKTPGRSCLCSALLVRTGKRNEENEAGDVDKRNLVAWSDHKFSFEANDLCNGLSYFCGFWNSHREMTVRTDLANREQAARLGAVRLCLPSRICTSNRSESRISERAEMSVSLLLFL